MVDFNQGETCDDGNTAEGDGCPAQCVIRACTPSGTSLDADVHFTPPTGVDLSGLTVFVGYPDGVVRIPGTGNGDLVQSRLFNLPENTFSTPNDLDYALRLVIFAPDSSAIPAGRLFTLQFDNCVNATPPEVSDFSCLVEDAADTNANTVAGVSCSVILP